MLDDLLGDLTTEVLKKALDASTLRQQVIANNVANAETPGFKRSEVLFESYLADAIEHDERVMESPQPGEELAIPSLSPKIVTDLHTALRGDGNNVNVEREMADLARNATLYRTYAKILASRYRGMNQLLEKG